MVDTLPCQGAMPARCRNPTRKDCLGSDAAPGCSIDGHARDVVASRNAANLNIAIVGGELASSPADEVSIIEIQKRRARYFSSLESQIWPGCCHRRPCRPQPPGSRDEVDQNSRTVAPRSSV